MAAAKRKYNRHFKTVSKMERNNLIPDIGITDPRKNNVSDAV